MNKVRIIRYLIYFINLPMYYISYLFPKNKNVWIFGAWFGEKYADNSKALFEFVNKHDEKIVAIWLTQSKTVFKELKQKGLNVYYTYSLFGYYYSAIARYVFVTTGMHDVNRFVSSNNIKVQLWHGTPLKKIMNDDKLIVNKKKSSYALKQIFFPFNAVRYQYLLSSSENINNNLISAFGNKIDNIIVKGYPRNDMLFAVNNKEKTITFLPTHRGEGQGSIQNIFQSFDSKEFNNFLEKKSCRLLIKPHFYDLNNITLQTTEYINILKDDINLYQLLSNTDILITDYSSVYFDFLLLDRPIIFTPFDFKEYISKDREMYYDYDKVTPGPRCGDWNEVMHEIEKLVNGEDNYSNERMKINNYFNKYKDGESSRRVYEFFKNLS
jgi:CDP-glycerol glycerophosphotransferase (TagB/SpsB family)